MPPRKKNTLLRKAETPVEDVVEQPTEPVQDTPLFQDEPAPLKKELRRDGPFATRQQQLDLLTIARDGKWIFQGRESGQIITTDSEGFKVPRLPTAKQLVFNSTPQDLKMSKSRFVIGEVVYMARPMSKARKVYAGRVTGFDHRGVLLDLLGAIGESKMGRKRTLPDGTIIAPYAVVFKDAQALQAYLDQFRDDFTRSQTDFRHLLELARKGDLSTSKKETLAISKL